VAKTVTDALRNNGLQPEGLELEVTESLILAEDNRTSLALRDLRAIGVDATPRTVEWGTFLSRLRDGDFDGAVNRWVEPTQIDLEDVWHTPPEAIESSNYGRYSNPGVDRLIQEVADVSDIDLQKELYGQIQQLIVADQPYTFLVEGRKLRAISTRVRGSIQNDATPYFNLEAWELP